MSKLSTNTIHSDTNILDQLTGVFARHVDVKPHYTVGLALWSLYTHKYLLFDKAPRLVIKSPVKNCGKSTVLGILETLVWNPKSITDSTAASLIRYAGGHTMLLDEGDNLDITKSMRAVLNDGYTMGKTISRVIKGEAVDFNIYGPVALAAIGTLPATFMSRALVVNMDRAIVGKIERFDPREAFYLGEIESWAERVNLNPDPRIGIPLGRSADNWRPLISIADALDRGHLGRQVMIDFLRERDEEDINESLLRDTKKVFDDEKAVVLPTEILIVKLLELEDAEVDYSERKLTKSKVAHIFKQFRISNRPHQYKRKVQRCWFREDFEDKWKRYI